MEETLHDALKSLSISSRPSSLEGTRELVEADGQSLGNFDAFGAWGLVFERRGDRLLQDAKHALNTALVAMKIASVLPGVAKEYDFGPAIEECSRIVAVWNKPPTPPTAERRAA